MTSAVAAHADRDRDRLDGPALRRARKGVSVQNIGGKGSTAAGEVLSRLKPSRDGTNVRSTRAWRGEEYGPIASGQLHVVLGKFAIKDSSYTLSLLLDGPHGACSARLSSDMLCTTISPDNNKMNHQMLDELFVMQIVVQVQDLQLICCTRTP